jgi:signal transduction histidine kinase
MKVLDRIAKTVQGKLLVITMVSTMVSIFIFAFLVLAFDLYGYRKALNREMLGIGELIARTSRAPLLFDDRKTGEEVLQSIQSDSRIKAAFIYKTDGTLFAGYSLKEGSYHWTNPKKSETQPTVQRRGELLLVSVPVRVEEDIAGWVILFVGTQEFLMKAQVYIGVLCFLVLLAGFAGWFISRNMQNMVLLPINELLVASRLISQERNYQFRVAKHSDDEIGALIDSFNEMLVQINARDKDLVHARDKLEQRVVERTRELQSEVEERKRAQQVVNNLLMKISEDNEALVRLDRLKSDFLSIVSHELRTPLTAIMGYLKLLIGGAAGPVNDTQKEFLRTVTRNSERLYQLVNDLLDLSRLEAGKIQLVPNKFNVAVFLESAIASLSSLANPKSIELVLVPPAGDVFIEADASRIEQVVVNLVGNAIKFTLAKGRVELGAREVVKEGVPGIDLWVKDNGIGMSAESLKHIFDRFYQAENSSTRVAGGTGLGLPITQKLVESHGGWVTVESEEGKGTTFLVFLPKEFKGKASGEEGKPD